MLVHVKSLLSFANASFIANSINPGNIAGILSRGDTNCIKTLISFLFSKAWQVFPWTVLGVYVTVPSPPVVLVKHDSMLGVIASSRSSVDFSNSAKKLGKMGWVGCERDRICFTRARNSTLRFCRFVRCNCKLHVVSVIPFSCLRRVSCDVLVFWQQLIGSRIHTV